MSCAKPDSIQDQLDRLLLEPPASVLVKATSTGRKASMKSCRPLWDDLIHYNEVFQDLPRIVAGDFNAIKDPSDRVGGSNAWIPSFDEFHLCLAQTELVDLRYIGLRFTWSTSFGAARKMRKIDRVLINNLWNHRFSFYQASFLNPSIFDHSPMIVRVLDPVSRRKPFKYFHFWSEHPDYSYCINQAWNTPVFGVPMFRLVSKLKLVKARLILLNKESFSNISMKTAEAREALRITQVGPHDDPSNSSLADLEKNQ
ncbi:uncharacterized protein LOC120293993 [Eucalyptus grandis]|uniref:uncharacterized protein LOC120293993 n=1 Tax=Eucalyptus grandis TaxID=71139 RepID=UPI00192E90AE|nr:uncharacterized protein LOC120293993 [Eucalyptus grandis]